MYAATSCSLWLWQIPVMDVMLDQRHDYIYNAFCTGVCLRVLSLNDNITWTVTAECFSMWQLSITSGGIVTAALSSHSSKCVCRNVWMSSLILPCGWQRWQIGFTIHVSALQSVIYISPAAKANIVVTEGNGCTRPACPLMYMMDIVQHDISFHCLTLSHSDRAVHLTVSDFQPTHTHTHMDLCLQTSVKYVRRDSLGHSFLQKATWLQARPIGAAFLQPC